MRERLKSDEIPRWALMDIHSNSADHPAQVFALMNFAYCIALVASMQESNNERALHYQALPRLLLST